MASSIQPIQIPDSISDKLQQVGKEKSRNRVATWIVGGLALLLFAMCVAMYVDWMLTLFDPTWRIALTLTTLITVAIMQIVWLRTRFFRGYKPTDLATEVDYAMPQLEERWSTVAEIAASPPAHHMQIDRGMMQRLSHEATAWEPQVRPAEILSSRTLVMAAGMLCAMLWLLFVAMLVDWSQTSVLIGRFWLPTANISATRITEPSGDFVVGRGESFALGAKLEEHIAPEATLFLRSGQDEMQHITLFPKGDSSDQLSYRVKTADESFDYRFRAGDGQTDWYRVTVAERPEIADVRFRVIPPKYSKQENVELKEFPHKMSVLEGSRLDIALRPREAATEVMMCLTMDGRPGSKKQIVAVERLQPDKNGWFHYRATPHESLTLSPVLTESHGLKNRRPPVCRINVFRDQPPAVGILSPEENMAIRADDTIEVSFKAQDDIAISKAELVVYKNEPRTGEPTEFDVIEIPLEVQNDARQLQDSVLLDLAKYDLKEGDELEYAVRVFDNRQASGSSKATANFPAMQANSTASDLPSPRQEKHNRQQSETHSPSSSSPASTSSQQSSTMPKLAQKFQPNHPSASNRSYPQANQDSTDQPKSPSQNHLIVQHLTAVGDATGSFGISPKSPKDSASSDPPPSQASATQKSGVKGSKASSANNEDNSPQQALASAEPSAEDPSSAVHDKRQQAKNSTKEGKTGDSSTKNQSSSAASGRFAAASPKPSDQSDKGQLTGAPEPPTNMTKRMLDIGQCTCSCKKKIQIDRWAGSYAGLQRQKLEIEIAPALQEIDDLLFKAENYSRQALDRLEQNMAWAGQQDRWLSNAESILQSAKKSAFEWRGKTEDTPYAFVGLQLSEIVQSHITPAHESLWLALKADANAVRLGNTKTAWQQICRARQRLQLLTQHFERIRREHCLADTMLHIKTMYRVFLEDSFIILNSKKPLINRFERSMVQNELTEEDLKRIEEVLAKKRALKAELARIFAEDPRLLRRYTNLCARQTESLNDQLTLLALRQQQIDRELRAWIGVKEEDKEALKAAIIRLKLAEAGEIASSVAQMHENFIAWLPFDLNVQDESLVKVRDLATNLAADARSLQTAVNSYGDNTNGANTQGNDLASFARLGRGVHDKLKKLDIQLRLLSTQHDHSDLSTHTFRRLAEVGRLIARTSAWVTKIERLDAGKFNRAVEVDQYTLATDTNQLTANLIECLQNYTNLFGRSDEKLPEIFAEKSRELFSTLDDQIAPNQLATCFALNQNMLTKAAEKTKQAITGFEKAERQLSELTRMIITELDKRPVQSPTAATLKDPTLDRLFALLEDERDCRAGLGIPCCRPSNLKLIEDWLIPGTPGSSGGSAGMSIPMGMEAAGQREMMLKAYLGGQQRRANELLQQAYEESVARALKESGDLYESARRQLIKNTVGTDWNVLVSQLEDELLQARGQLPPEQYRQAIEQYFDEISRTNSTKQIK